MGATGVLQWHFELDPFQKPATTGDAERIMARLGDLISGRNPLNDMTCGPDACSQPVIGGDGTAYQAWQDGKLYAIRDANGDGFINRETEVSTYSLGDGSQGSLAIAPHMLVSAPCGG